MQATMKWSRKRRTCLAIACSALAAVLLTVGDAGAQTGPEIVIKPWDEGARYAETNDELVFIQKRGASAGGSVAIFTWNSDGRVKFDPEDNNPSVVVGYKIDTISLTNSVPVLTSSLNDIALVGGFELGEFGDGWQLVAVGGAGTANDGHWNGNSVYGVGSVVAHKALDQTSSVELGIWYDGNSNLLPDVPLPHVAYVFQLGEDVTARAGFPDSSMIWTPLAKTTLAVIYSMPTNVDASLTYDVTEDFGVYSRFVHKMSGFHRDTFSRSRRLFYQRSRAEVGISWSGWDWLGDLRVAGGYAFDQRFAAGFDIRRLTTVTNVSDGAYMMVGVRGTF